MYNGVVQFDSSWDKGGEAVNKLDTSMPVQGANNIGTAGRVDPTSWFGEGGIVSRIANNIPGVNAVAGMHDVFQVRLQEWGGVIARNTVNIPGMIPAAALTYSSLLEGPPSSVLTVYNAKGK